MSNQRSNHYYSHQGNSSGWQSANRKNNSRSYKQRSFRNEDEHYNSERKYFDRTSGKQDRRWESKTGERPTRRNKYWNGLQHSENRENSEYNRRGENTRSYRRGENNDQNNRNTHFRREYKNKNRWDLNENMRNSENWRGERSQTENRTNKDNQNRNRRYSHTQWMHSDDLSQGKRHTHNRYKDQHKNFSKLEAQNYQEPQLGIENSEYGEAQEQLTRNESRRGNARQKRIAKNEWQQNREAYRQEERGFSHPKHERHKRGGERFGENNRELREKRSEVINEIPVSITAESLDSATRAHLRNLNRENSVIVARHLAYAGEILDIDPEAAYRHAKAAFERAARIDVVREALGITAYLTGRYKEALSELRTYRRMSNDFTHVALEADAERGMGRSEKALRFISEIPLSLLSAEAKIELALVASGARADVGDSAGGLAVVEKIIVQNLDPKLGARVKLVQAERLTELGREQEAEMLRAKWSPILNGSEDDTMMVLDLEEVFADEEFVPENSTSKQSQYIQDEAESSADEAYNAAFDELFDGIETPVDVAEEISAEVQNMSEEICEITAQEVKTAGEAASVGETESGTPDIENRAETLQYAEVSADLGSADTLSDVENLENIEASSKILFDAEDIDWENELSDALTESDPENKTEPDTF